MTYATPVRLALRATGALALALTALSPSTSAQREWGGQPPSLEPAGAGAVAALQSVETVELPLVDNEALRIEDELRPRGGARRFAFAHEVELDARRDGRWTTRPDGSRGWRLQLRSEGALSLSLAFSRFQLPAGGELYVYDAAGEVVRGAYTSRNHKPSGRFAIQPTPGEVLNLEYWQPAGASGAPELVLSSVYHAYRPIFAGQTAGRDAGRLGVASMSGACQLDVACPEGQPFADQVDGIVHILNGIVDCSGALINNTAEDGRLLVLTAEHCSPLGNDLSDAIFTFHYVESSCGGTGATRTQTVQGSEILSIDAPLDFQLVELQEQPAEAFGVRYLGWDRTDVPPAGGTVGLHHPQGDPMKIAIDDDPPTFNGTFWNIAAWDVGTTEPGSSGSPLLDVNGRVLGQLSNGTADCNSPLNDNYGRMAAQWSLVGPILDPLGTGALTLDAFDPNAGSTDPLSISATVPSEVPVLMPGTGQDLELTGTGFQDGMSLSIGGIAVPGATRVHAGRMVLDAPQLPLLGPTDVVLTKGAESVTFQADVVAADPIQFQAGTGDDGDNNQVGSLGGVDMILAGTPGDLHLLVYSFSDLPSSHPFWELQVGNGFTDLISLGCYVIGAGGTATFNVPISGLAFVDLYGQTTNLSNGVPFEVSNLQNIFVLL